MKTAAVLILLCAAAPKALAGLTPEADQALQDGLKDLYALNYAQSRADFHKLIEEEPNNPFGYLFESGGIWWESSQEYGLFQDTPALEGLFEKDFEAAIRTAEAWSNSKDRDQKIDGHFALGMALGTEGQWSLLRRHWVKAFFDGKKAVKHLRKAQKLGPDDHDVDLGLGVFDYQAAHLGAAMKLGALLGGMHGDENRGLAELELALNQSRHCKPQSAVFLATIYIADRHDDESAERYVAGLRVLYPDSVYFQFLELALKQSLGDWDGSLADGQELFRQIRIDPAAFQAKMLTLICGMRGTQCLARSDIDAAVLWLDRALASLPQSGPSGLGKRKQAPPRDQAFPSLLHLFRGYARDLIGQRQEALSDYEWVLSHPDFSDDHARARELVASPLTKSAFLSYLRALSR